MTTPSIQYNNDGTLLVYTLIIHLEELELRRNEYNKLGKYHHRELGNLKSFIKSSSFHAHSMQK
jgi:hypothetical protein